jgi:hypothetical protein
MEKSYWLKLHTVPMAIGARGKRFKEIDCPIGANCLCPSECLDSGCRTVAIQVRKDELNTQERSDGR